MAASAPVPFFGDFSKAADKIFKPKEYNFGKEIEINAACSQSVKLKGKLKDASTGVSGSMTSTFKQPWGQLEVIEDLNPAKSLEVKVKYTPKCERWNQFVFSSKHHTSDAEITTEFTPKSSFYRAKLVTYLAPNLKGDTVVRAKLSASLLDNNYNLAVGAQGEVEAKGKTSKFVSEHELIPKSYSMGFRYTPDEDTECTLVYTPNENSSGSDFNLTLMKKASESCTIAARAQGRADVALGAVPPVISFGGIFKVNGNNLMGFMNSRREYGAAYKVALSNQVHFTMGIASFLGKQSQVAQTTMGYKLCIS